MEWAKCSLAGGFFAQTCFIAQQAGEKALKSYCFSQGFDLVRTHSLFQIVKSIGENGNLEKYAGNSTCTTSPAATPTPFRLEPLLRLL